MESIPLDIVQDIVSRVPAESVLECKLVCRRWETLIRGSGFTNMHLSHQLNHLRHDDEEDDNDNLVAKVEPCLLFACRVNDHNVFRTLLFHGGQISERTSVAEKYNYCENLKRIYHPPMHTRRLFSHLVGSCNGLVCAFQHHHAVIDPIYICNPLTREYVYLPQLVVKKEDMNPELLNIVGGEVDMRYKTACGFGYVKSTNEYKVVRIHYLGSMEGNVEVYTLGSGCGWRAINSVPYRLKTEFGGRGTYANDAIYWISSGNVVAFDLAAEEFRLLAPPPRLQNLPVGCISGLVALGRHLCLHMDVTKSRMEIWSFVESNDSNESWRMEFDIDYEAVVAGSKKSVFSPILLTQKGGIIFVHGRSVLYCYDTRTALLRMISDEAFETVEPIAHVNTLVSLEAMGENSKRYTVRPRRDHVTDELDRHVPGEEIETSRFRLE